MNSDDKPSVTGGVWVACSERLPERHHGDASGEVFVRSVDNEAETLWYKWITSDCLFQYWLDTTQPIMTVADHDAAIAKLHKEFGCELRDPNGTIWDQAARLQKENEELRARIEELKELANSVCLAEDGVWCYGVNKENWFDAKNRILKGCKDGD